MQFASHLAALYATFGEPVTVAGSPITAIFDGGYAEAAGVAGTQPSLRCRASDVAAVVRGAAVVRASVNYTVVNIEPLPPDQIETRLILQRS